VFPTLPVMMDADVVKGTVRVQGSNTRNLLRVKRGLDLNRQLFKRLLADQNVALREVASKSYEEVFAPYHGWAIRKAVAAGMFALPTKQQFLKKLGEDETSWRAHAERYVDSSGPIILYIEELFASRNIPINW